MKKTNPKTNFINPIISTKVENKNICKNCNSPNINNYCIDCGQKVYNERFTIKSFFVDLLDALNLERGFFFTSKMLFISPGKVINDYLGGKTKSYINPLKYLLIIGSIYAFLILWLKIFDVGMESIAVQGNSEKVAIIQNQWLGFYKKIINLIPILLIPFISIATKWFYKSKGLFYGEHLIVNSFIFLQIFLITILLTPLVLIFPSTINFFPGITLVILIVYFCYSLNSTFRGAPFRSVLIAFLSLLIGYLLFMLFVIVLVSIISIIMILNQTP